MYTRQLTINAENTEQYVCYDADKNSVIYTKKDEVQPSWCCSYLNNLLLTTGHPVYSAVALLSDYVWLRLFMRAQGASELLRDLTTLQKANDSVDAPILKDMSRICFTKDGNYIYCDRIIIKAEYVLNKHWLQDVSNLKQFSYFKAGRLSERPTRKALNVYLETANTIQARGV